MSKFIASEELAITRLSLKKSLMFYYDIKLKWARETHTIFCRVENTGLARFKVVTWNLGGGVVGKKVSETGRCPLRRE
jgi:hypothetical protein